MESKISNIEGAGEYSHQQYGLLYRFIYEFEDGQRLRANHKTEISPFNLGDTAEYTKTGEFDGTATGKVSRPAPQGSASGFAPRTASTGKNIERQWAIRDAMNYLYNEGGDPTKVKFHHIAGAARELLVMRDTLDTYGLRKDEQ